jgi:hypothetical protein
MLLKIKLDYMRDIELIAQDFLAHIEDYPSPDMSPKTSFPKKCGHELPRIT